MVTAADRARYEKAAELYERTDFAQAYPIYEQLAREGDPNCQVMVGLMLYGGNGVLKDEALALEWFRKAASLGSAKGAFYYGRAAAIAKNYPEALRFFNQAAQKDYSPAILWLGLVHIRGYGVPVDLAKGLTCLRRAAALGNFYAQRELAVLMIKGKLGLANVAAGLVLFPYYFVSAAVEAIVKGPKGHSEKFTG